MAVIADLAVPAEVVFVDNVQALPAAFPVVPTAWGFAITIGADPDKGVSGYFAGALQHEGSHMEPTIGQIWPR